MLIEKVSGAGFRAARRISVCASLALAVAAVSAALATPASAQAVSGGSSESNSSNQATNTSNPSASVIVQSITGGGGSGRATPNAPGMPSFAGGACIGESIAASTAIPGVSFGGGMSKEDESCQRRNWIQTLIGAAQHMSPEDAVFMNRLAFEVMREDKFLSGGLERLGVAELPEDTDKKSRRKKKDEAKVSAEVPVAYNRVARIASVCTVVVAKSAPAGMKALLAAKGCAVVVR